VNECVLVAAPGGNPAPVVSLVWALHRQWDLRVASAHLLLYRNAERYLNDELLGGMRPLDQLRDQLGDPALAQLNLRLVQAPDGSLLEDDSAPEHAARYVESLWSLVRQVQADQPLPLVFGLVGGRRRTLTVDMAAVFQLLGRPQDRLVDLRLDPKYADDPTCGFFFPDQQSPCDVRDLRGRDYGAPDVTVSLVEPRLPRLRRLLREQDLASFAHAIEAGEAALEHGSLPRVVLDLKLRRLHVNDLTFRLSADQMIWYATLAVVRQQGGDGWVDVRDTAILERMVVHCNGLWHRGGEGIGAASLYTPTGAEERVRRLRFIRSRLRRSLRDRLRGHPHRSLLVPEQRFTQGRKASVERLGLDGGCIRVEPSLVPTS
jgi:CRISPR-associated protein (TIGR02584 family)